MQKKVASRAAKPEYSASLNSAAGSKWTYGKRGYALAQSLRQLTQRKFSSLITLAVLGITLALPALFLFSAQAVQQLALQNIDDESITLYLRLDTADLDGAELAQTLLGKPGIQKTRFISRDEALATFQANTDIGNALEALGNNPLPSAIVVYPVKLQADATAIKRLSKQLLAIPQVQRVQYDLRWVQRLQAAVKLIQNVGWILAGFLTLTALLFIGNTIRLELLRRQPELDVAKLLGAGTSFIHRPLLYTGALYGFLGGLVGSVLAMYAFSKIKTPADQLSHLYSSTFQLEMPTASQFLSFLIVATLLGWLGALITLYSPSRKLIHTRHAKI